MLGKSFAMAAAAVALLGTQARDANAPARNSAEKTEAVATASPQSQKLSQKVSKQFSGAPFSEVLDWMKSLGVNFVVEQGAVPESTKLTINFEDQPLRDVIDSIADVLGGHWTKRGDVFAFSKGRSAELPLLGSIAPEIWKNAEGEPLEALIGPKMKGELAFPGKDGVVISPDEFKAITGFQDLSPQEKKELEGLGEKIRGEVLSSKDWSKFAKEMEMQAQDMQKAMKAQAPLARTWTLPGLNQSKIKALAKQMAELGRQMAKVKGDAKKLQGLSQKMDSLSKQLEQEATKAGSFNFAPKARAFETMPEFKFDAKAPRVRSFNFETTIPRPPAAPKFNLSNAGDLKKLMESITPQQKEIMKSKGYLTPADLSSEQKKLLGQVNKEGDWTISYSVDGASITIKNK